MGRGGPRLTAAGTFAALYVAYAVTYVCRRLNYALLVGEGVVAVEDVGSFGSAFEIAGGLVKVAAGLAVDLASPSAILTAALAVAGAANALFFAAPGVGGKVALWGVNGAAQALAWPAAARIFLSWFPHPAGRGTWYSALSTSQNFGAALAPYVLAPAVAVGGWRASLYAPGALGLLAAAGLAAVLRDAPPPPATAAAAGSGATLGGGGGARRRQSVKPSTMAAAPTASNEDDDGAYHRAARPHHSLASILSIVTTTRRLWLLGGSYFANTLVRTAVTDWAWVFLTSSGVAATPGTVMRCISAYEAGGAVGGLAAGWVSDRVFRGRRGPVMALASWALVPLPLAILWAAEAMAAPLQCSGVDDAGGGACAAGSEPGGAVAHALLPLLYFVTGAVAFAPHVLNGLASGEAVPPFCAASAGALSKTLAQMGGAVAGLPLGRLAAARGWGTVMGVLAAIAAAGAATVTPLWDAVAWTPPSAVSEEGAAAAAAGGGGERRRHGPAAAPGTARKGGSGDNAATNARTPSRAARVSGGGSATTPSSPSTTRRRRERSVAVVMPQSPFAPFSSTPAARSPSRSRAAAAAAAADATPSIARKLHTGGSGSSAGRGSASVRRGALLDR